MTSIGHRLRQQREKLLLSQQALADACGVTMRSQRNYEGDKRSPDTDYMAKAEAAGVDVAYVLSGETQRDRAVRYVAQADRENNALITEARKSGLLGEAVTELREESHGDSRMADDELVLLDAYRKSSPAARHAIVSNAKAFAEEAAKAQAVKRKKT